MSTIEAEAPNTQEQIFTPEMIESYARLQSSMEARLKPEVFVDQADLQRTEFSVADGVSLYFRGREELPTHEREGSVVTAVLSQQERPLHTSGDDFGEWVAIQTQGNPTADPFERAVDEDAESVVLIALATPEGVVDTAITLCESGFVASDPARIEALKSLKERIAKREIDDEVINYYDQLYASTTVGFEDGLPTEKGRLEQGLIEVALMLTGDSEASDIVAAKTEIRSAYDAATSQEEAEQYGYESDTIRQPGEQLTPEELEMLAEKHLVLVHTSPVEPMSIDQSGTGMRVMRPRSEFQARSRDQYLRSTLHWSLNHPVESHMQGNFSGREFTIIAPMEKVAELNGAPAVLYGVDTYYTTSPSEGMLIPAEATILDMHNDQDSPIIEQTGNTIKVREGAMNTKDLQELTAFVAANFAEQLADSGADIELIIDRFLEQLTSDSQIRNVYGERSIKSDDGFMDDVPSRQDWLKQARSFYAFISPYLENGELPDYEEDFKKAVQSAFRDALANPGRIEQFPEFAPIMTEAIRTTIVKLEIGRQGGRVVRSDGMSAYIEDPTFSNEVKLAAEQLGVRQGLHQYQPERSVEQAAYEALNAATTTQIVDEKTQEELVAQQPSAEVPEEINKNFDWKLYDSGMIWSALARAPQQVRRTVIDAGMLTFGTKSPKRKHFDPRDLSNW